MYTMLYAGRSTSTPHARGSTLGCNPGTPLQEVYPACAGIHRSLLEACHQPRCLPRMRGDPPHAVPCCPVPGASTPHARGSTPKGYQPDVSAVVYPACAGIHLPRTDEYLGTRSLPRMRGDPPLRERQPLAELMSTPHARGSTRDPGRLRKERIVYPACAGIHRMHMDGLPSLGRLPRMRGDPPQRRDFRFWDKKSTPHARGSTLSCRPPFRSSIVYPACAGIHPSHLLLRLPGSRLPRMRGDPPLCERKLS